MPIRTLRSGERIPTRPPKRYLNRDGYIRLRWHSEEGRGQHVEVYEHRVADGVVTDAPHVHHRNENRGDNEPGNLEPLTATEHRRRHRTIDRVEAVRRYEAGETTVVIAAGLGCSASTLSRVLRAEGVTMRHESVHKIPVDEERLRELHGQGVRVPGIAAALGVPEPSVRRAMRERGLAAFPAGRPRLNA